jgi:hypothetical protein
VTSASAPARQPAPVATADRTMSKLVRVVEAPCA